MRTVTLRINGEAVCTLGVMPEERTKEQQLLDAIFGREEDEFYDWLTADVRK